MRNSKAFKEEAVARIRANEVPMLVLARQYGVSTNTLRAWLRDSDMRMRADEAARRVASTLSIDQHVTATQRERLLMHAMEYSPATIIITDHDGKIVYANPKLTETTGYALTEVLGQTPRFLKSGETTAAQYRDLWKTITQGKEWRGTFHNRRKDGSLYWERASISPVLDADGRIVYFMAVKEDVTEYMVAEQAQHNMAVNLLTIINALPGGVMVVDALGEIRFANEAMKDIVDQDLPEGTPLASLKLRWTDKYGHAYSAANHPMSRILPAASGTQIHARVGITVATGSAPWLETTVQAIQFPNATAPAALLLFAPPA